MASNEDLLCLQFDRISQYVTKGDEFLRKKNEKVSLWSIAEQLDHITKVGETILRGVLQGKELGGKGINPLGRIICLFGYMPRGVADSPTRVKGVLETAEKLNERLLGMRSLLEEYQKSAANLSQAEKVIPHPYFRNLTRPQALRFLRVHNEHHFKIIRDILK